MRRINTDFVRDTFAAMQNEPNTNTNTHKPIQPTSHMDSIQQSLNLPSNIFNDKKEYK